jgi:hypothetical protein
MASGSPYGNAPERGRRSIEKKDFPLQTRDLDCTEHIVSRHIVRDVLEGKLQQLRNAPIPNSFRRISENYMVGASMGIAEA